MEETQRQNLVQAFNNVLRTSGLVGVVDLQRAVMAYAGLLQQIPDKTPIPLGPLYDFLLEQKGPEPAVREVLVFMKSRESRFNCTFDLPPQLANLSPEEQQKIIVAFTARGASSGTYAGKSTENTGGFSRPNTRTPSPGSVTVDNPATPAEQKEEKKKEEFAAASPGMPTTTKLGIVLALCVVAMIVNVIVGAATATPPATELKITDPAGLVCVESLGNMASGSVTCKVSAEFVKQNPKEAIAAKSAITHAAIKAQGYKTLLVINAETSKMIVVLK